MNGYITGMEEPIIENRVNPKETMENVKSIIVCAFPYYIGDFDECNLSKYCYGEDYHIEVIGIFLLWGHISWQISHPKTFLFSFNIFSSSSSS